VNARILIIEDNRDLALGLRTSLEVEGYRVDIEHDGIEGLERIRKDRRISSCSISCCRG